MYRCRRFPVLFRNRNTALKLFEISSDMYLARAERFLPLPRGANYLYYNNLLNRLNPMTSLLGGNAKVLELYRLVVVPCVLENVSEKAWRPMRFSMPKPISASETFLKPMTLKFLSKIG